MRLKYWRLKINKILDLNFIALLKLKISGIAKGRVLFWRTCRISYESDSNLIVKNGTLNFNSGWITGDPFPSLLKLGKQSELVVNGNFTIYSGAKIYVNDHASLNLGSGYINHNSNISCFSRIEIGHNVSLSENLCIRDSDNHAIHPNILPLTKPIKIGNNVWIGMNVTILKGVCIGDGAIIAAGSVVNRDIPPNSLAGGVPAQTLKTNISWS